MAERGKPLSATTVEINFKMKEKIRRRLVQVSSQEVSGKTGNYTKA